MHFSVTFRHVDSSDVMKEYALEKIHKIKKYFPDPIQAHVVLSAERHLHTADVNITLHNGIVLKGHEATEDPYSSIDLVMAKIERQVRRYKDKIRDHKPTEQAPVTISEQIMAAEGIEKSSTSGNHGRVIKESKFQARAMTLDEAVMQMDLLENDVLVFQNQKSGHLNVVFRRRDGNYGLIDTGRPATKA